MNSEISCEAGRVVLSGLSGVREGQEVGGVAKCAAGKRSSWMKTKVEGDVQELGLSQMPKSFKENLFQVASHREGPFENHII